MLPVYSRVNLDETPCAETHAWCSGSLDGHSVQAGVYCPNPSMTSGAMPWAAYFVALAVIRPHIQLIL